LLALAVAKAAAAKAVPPRPAALDPVRCLVIAGALEQNQDPEVAQAGEIGSIYWLGRANGALPGVDLKPRMLAVAEALKGTDVGDEARRCGDELSRQGQEVLGSMQGPDDAAAAKAPPPK
jgi:hypothetical protein